MDVPALEVLERAGVHQDQRRVDDRSGVHQRTGQRVLDRLHRGKCGAQHGEGPVRFLRRKDAGRQARGADGDGDLRRAMLARQPGQGAGLGEGDVGRAAGMAQGLHHGHAAESPRRQEDHLAVAQMRRQGASDVFLGESRRRDQDQFGAAHRGTEVRRYSTDLDLAPAGDVLQHQAARRRQFTQSRRVASPETHFVTEVGKVSGGGVGTVATAQHRYLHECVPAKPVSLAPTFILPPTSS